MPSPKSDPKLEKIVLGLVALVVVGIIGAFAYSRAQQKPLPVIANVTDFSLTNQNDQAVSLAQLKGHVWIADIIFTHCPSQCVRMTKNMSTLQGDLPGDGAVKFVSLTADPGSDTPPALKKYGQLYGAKDNWIFLTGPKAKVYGLAMDGLKLAVEEVKPEERQSVDDLFIHSNKFIIVDKQGRIRAFFDGDSPESNPQIVATVKQLLKE